MKLLLVYDRGKQSVAALTAVVAAVARARVEGMVVEAEAERALDPSVGPVPSVHVDGVLAEGVDEIDIYNAIEYPVARQSDRELGIAARIHAMGHSHRPRTHSCCEQEPEVTVLRGRNSVHVEMHELGLDLM